MNLQIFISSVLISFVLFFCSNGHAKIAQWGILEPILTQCECGAPDQTMSHLPECPMCPNNCTAHDLRNATDAAIKVGSKCGQKIQGAYCVADFITPCNETSRECLVKSTQDAIPDFVKGIPALGVPVLDPFTIDKLSIPLSGLTFTFYKGKVSGFKKCIVDDIVSELEKRHFVLAFHCNLTIKGTYDATGRILLFPIDGAGEAKVKLTNLRMKVDINTKYVKDKEGLNHFGIRNYKYTFDYGDRVSFELQNLFKESKQLSTAVLQFLNENWRTVAEEFGKPIVDYAVELAIKTIEKFFIAVPYEELINVPIPAF